eukprot:scaffold4102_cov174-Ochromonas_danica.AAC.5
MSAWKLVEAEAETPDATPVGEAGEGNDRRNNGRGKGRASRPNANGRAGASAGGRGRGRLGNSQRTKADRSYFAYLAVQQIDQIFNPDSLCMDTYVRAYMDEAGYVPIGLEVANRSKFYELDTENETIRLKNGWEKFLLVNAYGGRGLPRYVKQQQPQQPFADENAYEGNVEYEGQAAVAEETVAGAVVEEANPISA